MKYAWEHRDKKTDVKVGECDRGDIIAVTYNGLVNAGPEVNVRIVARKEEK